MNNHYAKPLLIALALLVSALGYSQQYNSFEIRYQDNIRGDLTFIANNIVNRDGGTGSTEPEDPYNATGNSSTYNDWLNMQYIDVDSDPTTFSSSTATFNFPQASCNLIRYAGLYWAATYPSEQAGQAIGTNRQNDFNQVKLMVPGGAYVDVFADEILFDGFTSGDPSVQQNSPYACYADITPLITAMADPTGDYTIANVRSVVGSLSPGGGASGGWTIIIAYENPTLTGKLVTTFDGFARVRSANPTVDINYSGFNTIPVGPVRANIGAAALEGDNRITGDRMRIRAASNPGFTTMSNAVNPANNFFNSNITLNGAIVNTRNPNSINTLGYDTDMFLLNNPANSVIPNGETDATFRFTSSGDQYYPFFNSFNIEIIEPNIVVEKRVEDIAGNDITGLGVNLGQVLDYVLSFQNIGNDDATNYTLRDVLPINVTLIESNLVLPPGVTYVYDPVAHEVTFSIPDNLIEQGDPAAEIRMRVQVAENCFDFVDACSDLIANQAYSTYEGVINNNQITNDPSVSDFDNCGFVTPGATNFLLDDLESCDYSRTVQLCGDDLLLDAGDNFDAYVWYVDVNLNGVIDAGDTLMDDGDPDNDPSTMLVTDVGIYIVDKIVADPCKGFQEIITVELFGATQTNPIVDLINDPTNTVEGEVVVCPNDGDLLPRIFLCGLNDTELIQINIPDAQSIDWEQLDEASCPPTVADCANKDASCTWNNVGTGNNFLASDAGKYRVVINYQNGCFSRFYFDIFKNLLDPQYNVTDIICTTPGNITVTNMPANYEYQLLDGVTGNILVPYGPSPSFTINNNGAFSVEIRQLGVVDGCIFRLDNIGVLERNFQVVTTTKDTDCNGLGEISISALDVEPQYYYEISQGGVTIDTYGPSVDNNYTFQNLNDGVYDVLVTTDDGCSHTEQVTINDVTDLAVNAVTTKPIDCTDGIITVTGSGGFPNPDYLYAIWSYNGVTTYTDITDIPPAEFQVENDFTFTNGEEGDYVFVVVDGNNCWFLSNTATITVAPAVTYTTTAVDETCLGGADGSYTVNVTNYNGYSVTYTLTYPDTSTVTNASGIFTGLGQGNYSLTLTQTNGTDTCDFIETFTIGGPATSVTGTAVLIQDYTCLQNGIIEAQGVAGGTPPYEYSIDGVNFASGAGAETFSNLTNGTYNISIRDANGCVFVSNPVTIDPLDPPTDLTFTATPPNCPAQTSDVTATVVDGNAPFLFEIIAPAPIAASSITGNTADFNGLAPNTYTFRVTDDKGCTYEEDFTISPVVPIDVVGQLVSNVSCAGGADGEILFTVNGFATSYDYNVTGPSSFSGSAETNNTIPLTNLPAGTYDITVTDNDTNCTANASVVVAEPLPLTLAATETQPTCTTDGSVILVAADGWGSYTYSVTFPDTVTIVTNATGSFTGLNQFGTYVASVTDVNGCTVTTNFVLNSAVPPVLSIVPNDVCYDDAVGLILTANVTSGGDGNFEYRINGGPWDVNNVFGGLSAGSYTIDVRDGNDCTGSDSITINPELSVSATAINITACGTTTDVTITAAGGDGNYVYAIVADAVPPVPGDFGAANPITVTGAGDYDVYVRDNNGNVTYCEAMFDITIVQDAPIVITPATTPNICFGDSNGSITLNVTNGSAPYEYSIDNGTNYQVSNVFVNLPAGTYPVRVRDANGCEETASVIVAEPAQLMAEAIQTQAYTCVQFGEITVGSITPTSGGSGDYQYSINGGAWTPSTVGGHIFTNLIDGTYSISVRDANAVSCSITIPDVIIAPLPVEPILSTAITYNCDGTGNITVLPNDPSYMYSIDGGALQASNIFNNVTIGSHPITVDYGSGCTVDTSAVIVAGNALDANITNFTNLSCNGSADGTITFEVENFDLVNGFEYSVNGGAFSAPQTVSPITVNGLSAGAHTIEVRDFLDNSCTVTLSETLTEPAPLVASASITVEFTCNNTGATITASAIGGTPGYEFQLEDNVGGIITPYQAGVDFVSVPAGDYIIRARDTNNCEDPIDAPITVVAPMNPTFTTTPTACYSGANDGTILVDVTSIPGNGGFQFSINSGPWLTPTPSTATSYTFANLSSGNYTIDVKDSFGCIGVQQNVTINPMLTANAVLTADLTCLAPASININASGGSGTYSYEWSNDAGTTYFNTNFVGNVFSSNTDGTYIFRVTDTTAPAACVVITNSVIISPADTPVITTVTPTHILCNGDSTGMLDVVIDTSIGSPPYVINVVETISSTNYGTQTTGLPAGSYEVTITDDKGCVSLPFPAVITEPAAIAYNINLVPITCNPPGTDPGSITVENVSGGTAEYTYYLTGNNGYFASYLTTAGGEDHTFSILEFGIYEVDVVDANGCSLRTTNIIASPPNDLDIDVSTVTANCAMGGTAIVTVSSIVGSGSYEFGILDSYAIPYSSAYQPADPSPPAPVDTSTFTGLIPGVTYTFVVHDLITDCYYFESAALPIDTPSNMTISPVVVANVTCTGAADGNVSFDFDNFDAGAMQVDYEIFNAQSNLTTFFTGSAVVNPPPGPVSINNFATLPPGVYYLLLTEVGGAFNGCTVGSPNFTIDEATNLLSVTAASPTNDNCNVNAGVITATAQFGAPPYEFQYLLNTAPAPTPASPGWITSATASVESGDYIVYVKDDNDCIQLDPITVALDATPDISLAIVDECVAEGMFEILVTLDAPGVAPYQLSINGGPFQNIVFDGSNQYLVSGLNSGAAQNIAVRDVNGCSDTEPFTIIPPLEFTVMQTALLDCEPGMAANAEITIEVTSGSGTYEFEIDGPGAIDQPRIALPSNPYVWTGASGAGAYDVRIHDISTTPPNCTQSVIVDVPDAVLPEFTEIHTNVTCTGGADGSITLIEIDNGNNPLTYTLTPMPVGVVLNDKTFENVPAGTYDVRGTGVNDCFTDIFSITITEPAIMSVPAPTIVEFGCTSGNNPENATITIDDASITGGSGVYAIYEFINDQGTPAPVDDVVVQTGSNTTYIETDVNGGSYIINVYDSNGCLGSATAIILPYDELLTASAAITNAITCNPGMDGEITIAVTSVNMDPTRFEYSINNGATYQASNVFSGLDFGVYNFLIRHIDTGCILTATETIMDPNTFTIDVTVVQDVICFGTASGQVTFELIDFTYVGPFDWNIYDTNGTPLNTADDVLVTNGTSPTNGPTAPIALPEGEYLGEIIQNNHPFCTNTSLFNIAGPPAAITANTDVSPITCLGNDGIIEIIDVVGGWGGYTYYLGTVPPTGPGDYVAGPQFPNLTPGTYEAWVIDINGCEQMIQNNIVLADPAPITASLQINQENCINIQGEIEVIGVTGGQGSNYTYQLIKDAASFGAPQTTTVFGGLGVGTYEVQITDQWSCTFTTPPVSLYDEVILVSNVVKPIDCSVSPDGEITITATGGSGNFDFTVTFPDLVTTASNATGVFTGLNQAGPYSFVVSDLNTTPNCTYSTNADLDAPTPVTFDPHTIVDVSCNGLSDGSITVNLTPTAAGVNDNPPYVYNLYSGVVLIAGPQADPTFTGLAAGIYDVEAVSNRACSLRETVVINEPSILTATAVATLFACNPDNTVNTSTITVTVPVGAGTVPYLYSIDNVNFQSSNTFDIVDTGATQNITVYIADANGCTTTDAVTIEPINVFTAVVSQDVAISCAGPEEVTITVTDDGNPANVYTYELLPVGNPNGVLTATPTNVTAEFDLTAVGTYTFRVTDTNTGCYFDTAPYAIAPYDLIDVVATATAPVVCFGDTNGTLEINVSGYAGPYSYEVFTDAGVSTGITGLGDTATNPFSITGLSGGNYFVRVTETNNPLCVEDSNIITIVSPDMPLTTVVNPVANVTCTNDQGEILVDPDGGFPPYDIVLTNTTTTQAYNVNGVTSFVFSGLSAGNFTVDITDANGCVINDVEVLVQPTPITADITAVPLSLQCYGDTNATVTAINVIGGEGSYQYQLNYYDSTGTIIDFSSGTQISPIFNNVGAGIYSITVSDSWNCDVETVQVTITEPTEVEAALIQLSPMSCVNQAQLELSATGGTAPYEYSTDAVVYQPMSGGNNHVFIVTDGIYQYYVRDVAGCEAGISNQISVDPIIPLTISLDTSAAMINCTGEATAIIEAEAFGGLGNYLYELFGDAALTNLLAGPQADGEFGSLTAGSYWIRVTSIDCIEVTNEIIITEPLPLQIDRQDFTNVTCAGQEDGTIDVEVSGGTGIIYYAISPNLNKFDTVNSFTDLEPGVYDVIAQDENGCFIPFQFTIVEPMPLDANFTSTPEVCIGSADGTIDLTISGGTAPYSTALNSNNPADFIQDQVSFTNLAVGTYVVFITDALGCETNVIIQIAPGVNLNAIVEPAYICDSDIPDNYINVTMEDDTVLGSIMYALDSTDPADLQLAPDFTNMSTGSHYLTISHANGCMLSIDFEIESFEPLTLTLEQNNINEITAIATGGLQDYTFYFGDDDNGTDNTYYITMTDTYTVRVVDQNGCEMMAQIFMEFIDIEIPNFFTPDGDGMNEYWKPDNIEQWPEILIKIFDRYGREIARVPVDHYGWDGTYQGAELPSGDYWYVIKLEGERDDREFIGHFTLYR